MSKRGNKKVLVFLIAFIVSFLILAVMDYFFIGEKGEGLEGELRSLGLMPEEEIAGGGGAGGGSVMPIRNKINIKSCQILNESNSTYYLTNDIKEKINIGSGDYGSHDYIAEIKSTCFNIIAENIVLDCQNHLINAQFLEAPVIYSTAKYVTIKNCNLEASSKKPLVGDGKGAGIKVQADNNLIMKNQIKNSFFGIQILGENNIIMENTITQNAKGIYVEKNNNIIIKNLVKGNNKNSGYGINIQNGENNRLINNKISENKYGIFLAKANNTYIKCGLVYRDSDYDLYIQSSFLFSRSKIDYIITSEGIKYDKKFIGSGVIFKEIDSACLDVSCVWIGESCVYREDVVVTREIVPLSTQQYSVFLDIHFNQPVSVLGIVESFPVGWAALNPSHGGIEKEDKVEWLFANFSGLTLSRIEDSIVFYRAFKPETNTNNVFDGYWFTVDNLTGEIIKKPIGGMKEI